MISAVLVGLHSFVCNEEGQYNACVAGCVRACACGAGVDYPSPHENPIYMSRLPLSAEEGHELLTTSQLLGQLRFVSEGGDSAKSLSFRSASSLGSSDNVGVSMNSTPELRSASQRGKALFGSGHQTSFGSGNLRPTASWTSTSSFHNTGESRRAHLALRTVETFSVLTVATQTLQSKRSVRSIAKELPAGIRAATLAGA